MGKNPNYTVNLKKIIEYTKNRIAKAINDYSIIEDGDNILVALSGGKDSLTLLENLAAYKKFKQKSFSLSTVHIKLTDIEYGINRDFTAGMAPKLSLLSDMIEIIRPQFLLSNKETAEYSVIMKYPSQKQECTFDGKTMRTTARKIINSTESIHPNARRNIMNSLYNIDYRFLPNKRRIN
jgi:tRNA(Ile)-lysidine synthase TilS/MesJ